MSGVAGVRTWIEVNIRTRSPAAVPKWNVGNWEIECAVRSALQSCASGLVDEPADKCKSNPVFVTFEVLDAPDEEWGSLSEL